MGVSNAELFTNIGLCCFYAQQFDLAVGCLERAINASDNDNQADIWYNIGHMSLVCMLFLGVCKHCLSVTDIYPGSKLCMKVVFQASGDVSMAYQCFRLAIAANNDHAEAFTNLGVLEMRKGNIEQVTLLD